MRIILIVLVLTAVRLALALETARMELPSGFQNSAEPVKINGFGGRNKGNYRISDYRGEFKRGESRLGIMDPLYVSNKGKSGFTFDGTRIERLKASCQMKKGTVTIGIVTFDPKKFSYQCSFDSKGELANANLILGQPKDRTFKEKVLAADQRAGEAIVHDTHLTIESVHSYRGSRFRSSAPVGYLLTSGDELVGAVELTDVNPVVYLPRTRNDDQAEAVLVVALALAVLRDPANSAIED